MVSLYPRLTPHATLTFSSPILTFPLPHPNVRINVAMTVFKDEDGESLRGSLMARRSSAFVGVDMDVLKQAVETVMPDLDEGESVVGWVGESPTPTPSPSPSPSPHI